MTDAPASDPLAPPGALPPPSVGSEPQSDQKLMVIVVYALHLAGFLTAGVTNLIGVILSYVLKADAGSWARSHYEFQIRTFWIGLVAMLVGIVVGIVSLPLMLVLIGIPLAIVDGLFLLAISIWFVVRCVVGLINAAEGRPYPRPQTWMA